MKTIISIILIGLITFSGCVTTDKEYNSLKEFCESDGGTFKLHEFSWQHDYCIKNGEAKAIVCNENVCGYVQEKVVP